VSVASLLVFVVAVQAYGSSVRAAGIAVGSWFPAVLTLLGTLIAVRQPKNRIAWLLMGTGFAVLVEYFLQLSLRTEPLSPSPLDLLAIVLVHIALPAALYMLFLIAFLFPSGHFFTQRQALAAWPGVIMLSIVFLVTILSKEVGPPFPSEELAWTVTNPVGFLSASALDVAVTSMMVMLVLMAVGGALSLILRYRGSSVVTKAQIRWMLFSTLVVVGVFLLLVTTNASQQVTGGLLLLVAFTSIPLSMTVAITRYRLFEIDRIISRTVSYSVIVVVLGALFATGVVWLPAALGLEDSPLVVAATTLIVAALFNPLRRRVRNAVDRRFNRSHFEAILVEEQFAARLQQTHNTAEIADVLLKTVGATLGPKMSGLWLNTDDIDATHL
jgi:hypothetical protein